jgi:hypothetical protein
MVEREPDGGESTALGAQNIRGAFRGMTILSTPSFKSPWIASAFVPSGRVNERAKLP